MSKYFELLKSYCDRLVENQIKELTDASFHGGVLCPSCALIHGRIGDAVYPLAAMYDYTGDEKYLECARGVVEWSERNVKIADGGYKNDMMKDWIGISVFSSISFGEALLHHGDCLDAETRAEWERIHVRITDYVYRTFVKPSFSTNVNYFFAYCSALAIAYRLTSDEKYKDAAYSMAERVVREHITADGLIHGEGSPAGNKKTPKGSYGVDIGYNVEESLPALTAFAHYMNDEKYMEIALSLWRSHLELMLPDGAWDNSFGTRHNKWTYYGSRTSDGCQTGLCYIWDKDPIFAEAAERNFELIRECSRDGYLYGGRMYIEAGELPCLHHSFAHAKALAALIDSGFEHKERAALPRETEYGLRELKSVNVELVSVGDFRATVSGYDCIKYTGAATAGGAMTLLYHKDYGTVFASSVEEYSITEALNMQMPNGFLHCRCTTPRIENGKYRSINALDCSLSANESDGRVSIKASGVLRDGRFEESAPYTIEYFFDKDSIIIKAVSESGGTLALPVVCGTDGEILCCGEYTDVTCADRRVRLTSSEKIVCDENEPRIFNLVGGFIAANLKINLTAGVPCEVTLTVL
ncbi:MAG: hypothetical protein IJW03_03165 [Clostridia bacterium]|nr:hypothetical protein [Clostridia bacterium]